MAHILLVTHTYPPAIDGGSQVIYKIGQYLKSQGHQIMVLSSNATSTDDFTHSYKPVNSYLPVYTAFHRPLKLFSKVLSKGPIFKFIPFIKFLVSCIQFHPDYIISGPLPTTSVLYASFIKKITGARLIINASFHHTDPEFSQPLLIKALNSSDFIWTLTNFETNYFHQHFNIPQSKLINLGNGVDKGFIKTKIKNKKSNKIIFIGSMAAHKGIFTLIDAFSEICHLRSDYSLTLAGQKTLYSPIIENKINSLPESIKSRIKIIYNFKSEELTKLIDRSTVLVSPSTQESFGLVLLEAMARGVPVIGADIPASIELITKSQAGLIFQQNNAFDLAQKISQIRSNQNGITFALNHTWDKIGESLWQKISS
ncbi:MAG: glycosyltransferase family 4 protein [Microgenomates group bacterium]